VMRRLLRSAGVALVAVLALASPAAAHPLGNFTVNHLTRISLDRGVLHVRYVLDLAEIPAFSVDRALDPRGIPSGALLAGWARDHAREIVPQLQLSVDGCEVALVPGLAAVRSRPGAGGLPTLYFTAAYAAPIGAGAHRFVYRDRTESGRLGWKDVVTGVTHEPTNELRAYPSALLGSPRAVTELTARTDGAGRIVPVARAAETVDDGAPASPPLARSNALSDVLAKGAGDPLIVIGALLLALALGALHALEPGHGKTLLAVSLVGARATRRQALILATALTASHTAGVFALGAIVIVAAHWIVPERMYSWILLAAGIVVTIIGGRALAREVRRRLPVPHVHTHVHAHAQPHAHDHIHAPGEGHDHLDDAAHARAHAIPGTAPLTFRSAVVAAAAGNFAPCPAALVVLFAAIAQNQVGYGIALILAFSVGLAAVLTTIGIAVVRSAGWLVARPQFDGIARIAPLATSCVIATIGAVMIGQGLAAQGFGVPVPIVALLVLLAIVGYALAWHQHRQPAQAHA
jgi:nickel/cobalt exporter